MNTKPSDWRRHQRIQSSPAAAQWTTVELTTLTAGINEGRRLCCHRQQARPHSRGHAAQDNNYQLDGADNKEAFFHSWNLAPSVDAIQEFQHPGGRYSAEFGSGGGAVINVVTKSGTNQFRHAVEFIRNDKMDARNFFLTPSQSIAPLRRNQFGAAAGGRIVKDKMFIFGNYDARPGSGRACSAAVWCRHPRSCRGFQRRHEGDYRRAERHSVPRQHHSGRSA